MSLLAEQQASCLHKTQPPTAFCYVVTPSKLKTFPPGMRRKAPQSQEVNEIYKTQELLENYKTHKVLLLPALSLPVKQQHHPCWGGYLWSRCL